MAQLVVNSGICSCSMGAAPCTLAFLPTHKVTGCKQPAANIMDHVPFLNVSGFGMCNSIANPTVAAATAAALGVLTPALAFLHCQPLGHLGLPRQRLQKCLLLIVHLN